MNNVQVLLIVGIGTAGILAIPALIPKDQPSTNTPVKFTNTPPTGTPVVFIESPPNLLPPTTPENIQANRDTLTKRLIHKIKSLPSDSVAERQALYTQLQSLNPKGSPLLEDIVQLLLLELETVPEEDLVKKQSIYQQLHGFKPDHAPYKLSMDYFTDKLEAEHRKGMFTISSKRVAEVEGHIRDITKSLKTQYGSLHQIEILAASRLFMVAAKDMYEHSKDKKEKALGSKAAKLLNDTWKLSREVYASYLEGEFLSKGIDTEVSVSGKNKDHLTVKYVLINQVFVYDWRNDSDISSSMKVFGFKKVTLTNGYTKTWVLNY